MNELCVCACARAPFCSCTVLRRVRFRFAFDIDWASVRLGCAVLLLSLTPSPLALRFASAMRYSYVQVDPRRAAQNLSLEQHTSALRSGAGRRTCAYAWPAHGNVLDSTGLCICVESREAGRRRPIRSCAARSRALGILLSLLAPRPRASSRSNLSRRLYSIRLTPLRSAPLAAGGAARSTPCASAPAFESSAVTFRYRSSSSILCGAARLMFCADCASVFAFAFAYVFVERLPIRDEERGPLPRTRTVGTARQGMSRHGRCVALRCLRVRCTL